MVKFYPVYLKRVVAVCNYVLPVIFMAWLVMMGTHAKAQGYCQPTWSAASCSDGYGDYIGYFNFNNLTNTNLNCPTDPDNLNFIDSVGGTCITACSGQTYTISIAPGYYAEDEYMAMYIDLNGDDDFDDPGEYFYLGSSFYLSTVSADITIPVLPGPINTRLRIICQPTWLGAVPQQSGACGYAQGYGEAIDYCISIDGVTPFDLGGPYNQCGGNVQLDAQNPGAAYAWSTGATVENIVASTSGAYVVTVTAQNGCSATDTALVYINPAPVVNLGGPVTQCGGQVTLDAGNAGDQYAWSTNETTRVIHVTGTDNYTVTVFDPNSFCSASGSVDISIQQLPDVSAIPDSVTQCGGNYTYNGGNPNYNYLWSTGATTQTLTVSTSGVYKVTVTDPQSGCSVMAASNFYLLPAPFVNLGPDVTQCGGTVALSAGNPGDLYNWSTGETSQNISAGSSQSYSVTVTDPNSLCEATGSVFVNIYPVPVITIPDSVVICGGTTRLDAGNAGNAFNWSEGSTTQTIDISSSGTYKVTVTDVENQCSASAASFAYVKPKPVVYLGADVTQCGGSVMLDAGLPGDSYVWSPNGETTQTIVVSNGGTYAVTVTDANSGCTASDTADVTINPVPVVDLGESISQCGGVVHLDAGEGYVSYLWSDNSLNQTLNVIFTGNYSVTVTDDKGCSGSGSVQVNILPVPQTTFVTEHDICYNTPPFALSGGTPVNGLYLEADTIIAIFDPHQQGIGPHIIKYVFTNLYECSDTATAEIYVHPQPFVTTTLPPALCTNSPYLDLNQYFQPQGGIYSGIGVSQNFFYPNLSPAGNDTIVDIYTDMYGCVDTSVYPFRVIPPVHVSLESSVADFTICEGQDITFTASGADEYVFYVNGRAQGDPSTGNTFTTNTLINHSEVFVIGFNDCSTDTSGPMIIDVIAPPTVSAGPDTTIELGQHVILQGAASGSGLLIYQWTPETNLNYSNILNPTYSGPDSITFTLHATDTYGCTDSAAVSIFVMIPDNVLLPNIITPDGDGYNDVWKLNPKINLDGSHLLIFNRGGQTVYETTNYTNNWGGTYKDTDKKLPDGTYYYVMTVPAQHNHTYKGAINIINGDAK